MFFRAIRADIRAALSRDPAARNVLEVVLCYPSVHALFWYRVAHWLHSHRLRLIPRLISQAARFMTGIEIHPGAKIGEGMFIDHGMGVVIGETCEIGRNVTLYQDVTLGGTGKDVGKRHPTLGNDVLVGAGARVLGPVTIGDGAKVGAGAVVLKSVPAGCTVVGNPGRVVRCNGARLPKEDMDQVSLPDPLAAEISQLNQRLAALEAMLGKKASPESADTDNA